jgi:hypothetical protein
MFLTDAEKPPVSFPGRAFGYGRPIKLGGSMQERLSCAAPSGREARYKNGGCVPHPQAGKPGNLFGGAMPPVFTPASYPDFILAAPCRHPKSAKTCWVPKRIFYEKFPA